MQYPASLKVGAFRLVSVLTVVQVVLVLLAVAGTLYYPATIRWYRLFVVAAVVVTAITVLSAVASPRLSASAKRLLQIVFEGRFRSRTVITGLILVSLLCAASPFVSVSVYNAVPFLWSFLPFVLFWPLVTLWLLTLLTDPVQHSARQFLINSAIVLISLISFAVLLEIALQLMFPRLPTVITSRMPQAALHTGIQYATEYGARQYPSHQQVSFVVDDRFGDTVPPYCPFPAGATAEPPYRVQYARDAYGFRNSAEWPDQADLIVVGDSFVDGENVQRPFWMEVTPSTLGLGIQATGNTEQVLVLQEFGIPQKPEVVVMAYFEGNDLIDNMRFEEAQQAGETAYEYAVRHTPKLQFLVTYNLVQWLIVPLRDNSCPEAVTNAHGLPMALDYEYLSILTVDKNALLDSQAYHLTQKAILDAAALARSNDATFVLAYIPVKAHVYWNSLIEAGELSRMGGVADPLVLRQSVQFYNVGATTEETADLLAENFDDQRQVIAELAEQNGIPFLDFTPHFQEAATEGKSLYFYGDSHWNQHGHDLAHQVLTEFLRELGLISDSSSS